MFMFNKCLIGDLDDLVSSIRAGFFNFSISIEYAREMKKKLEYSYHKDKYHKYAYCYLSYKIQKYEYVDFYKVKNLIKELTDDGYIPAYNLMGNAYYYGWGVPKNTETAVKWYKYASDRGFKISTYNLALDCFQKKQNCFGQVYLEDCIEGGYHAAYYVMGYGHQFGKYGYPMDKSKALYYYELGARQNDTKCSYFAGSMYMSGIGCTVNHTRALKYLESAAMFDEIEAKFLCGVYYLEGKYVDKYYERALYYFEQASELGHIRAKAYVGLCYLNGYGCYRDRDKAIKYIKEAANKGDEVGKMLLSKL